MKGIFYKLSFLSLIIMLCCFAVELKAQEEISSLKENKNPHYNNPLKGLATFIFFTQIPATAKTIDKINVIVKDKLSSFGTVVPSSLLVQTKEGEAIDLSGFDVGATLIYELTNLSSLDGTNLGLKATLSLRTLVEINTTKRDCSIYVWSQSCFLKGKLDKEIGDSVSQSLHYLLQKFLNEYMLVNKEKPVFNLYQF